MSSLLQSGYLSVLEIKTKDELEKHVVRFAQELGFQTVTAMTVIDHFLGEPEFLWIDNAPSGYAPLADDPNWGKRDPVMQHCKHKSVPIIWNQGTYVAAGQAEKWEEQARFGYRHGIGLTLHMPEGRHFMLAVDRDQPLPKDPAVVTQMVAALQLYAVHAQEASTRVLLPAVPPSDAPSLTPRELETLRWTMEGKTAWEVANVLGISERTAVLHANNAMHKLGCVNKHQAVLKALRLGLIR
ncbi:autoinducer binding domain-containing protein [Rhizobacter sp. J219]|jgi:DNA-binding CsgD family transcriptional regulator|uniref:helix-turn-helix transcriptional regulator n=1 Tax=Rhizobacter sp. J219 TaxID=2898430 RepID=UPI00215082D6|nr:autoinducer binding domain-containing protein [Rhizobacter sp. J219]MCR5884520.1 autoinducer binding domain-containing protein [Rhizobacter sp. J219]